MLFWFFFLTRIQPGITNLDIISSRDFRPLSLMFAPEVFVICNLFKTIYMPKRCCCPKLWLIVYFPLLRPKTSRKQITFFYLWLNTSYPCLFLLSHIVYSSIPHAFVTSLMTTFVHFILDLPFFPYPVSLLTNHPHRYFSS